MGRLLFTIFGIYNLLFIFKILSTSEIKFLVNGLRINLYFFFNFLISEKYLNQQQLRVFISNHFSKSFIFCFPKLPTATMLNLSISQELLKKQKKLILFLLMPSRKFNKFKNNSLSFSALYHPSQE